MNPYDIPADTNRTAALVRTIALITALLGLAVQSCLGPVGISEDQIPVPPPHSEEPPDQPEDPPAPPEEPPDQPGDSPPPILALSIAIEGSLPAIGKTPPQHITSTAEYAGDIRWQPAPVNNQFQAFTDYTAVIELAMKGGHPLPPAEAAVTVAGALSAAYDAAAGTITAAFPRTHYPVNSPAELETAVAAISAPGENVIELTGDFYDEVNNNVITTPYYVTIGAGSAPNTVPYTVRGLGKDPPHTSLNAGILIANNNITLEQVRIEITDKDRGVPREWAGSLYYRAAVLVRRYTDSSTPLAAAPQNVTVRNCDISFTVNNSMIAGIYINNGAGPQDPINNISIAGNTVSVISSDAGYAAQALLIHHYDPSLSITGNGLKAQNIAATHSNPAGAILMQLYPDIDPSQTPDISGNTINGSPTYDFYINILSPGNRKGIPALFADKFATPASKWMTAASTDTHSFYKKLVETLLSQSRAGAGYGYLAMYLGAPAGSLNDCVFEAYAQESGKVVSIDFWGYVMDPGAYKAGGGSPPYTDNVRARLLLSNGYVTKNDAPFHWWANGGGDTNLP
jgi:hypothetical protein